MRQLVDPFDALGDGGAVVGIATHAIRVLEDGARLTARRHGEVLLEEVGRLLRLRTGNRVRVDRLAVGRRVRDTEPDRVSRSRARRRTSGDGHRSAPSARGTGTSTPSLSTLDPIGPASCAGGSRGAACSLRACWRHCCGSRAWSRSRPSGHRLASWRSMAAASSVARPRSRPPRPTPPALRCTRWCSPKDFGGTSRRRASRPQPRRDSASFLEHVEVVISLHGYGRPELRRSLLVGGADRVLAAGLASTLRTALPEYDIVDALDRIPEGMRGVHPANPVNCARGPGVQLELCQRVRESAEHRNALVGALAKFAASYADHHPAR